ncbi:MAG: hypothetical protein CTY12_00285 [Methylotenera sp.]|nr:MAG: hypothetical protein CTY12_00285 [Methylotenera sp.]
MADLISQKALFGVDPTEGFVQYTNAVKPYHTKILEVLTEYVYKEDIKATISEKWNWNVELTRPEVPVIPTCGFGVVWDSPHSVNDYPTVNITQAVSDIYFSVGILTDVSNPTHIVYANKQQFALNVGDAITFRSTLTLPTTSTGNISPGLVYYVTSVTGSIIEISNTLSGSPLMFVSAGTGLIETHLENLKFNTFLVDPEPAINYDCIATSVQANQLSFINSYDIISIVPSQKKITVVGILLSNGYQDVGFGSQKTGVSLTGLLNDSTVYNCVITIDSIEYVISVVGSAAQTFSDLISQLNALLISAATVSLVSGRLRITSNSIGYDSTVNIRDTNPNPLFNSMHQFGGFLLSENDTVAAVGKPLFIRNNGDFNTNRRYTIVDAIIQSGNTVITVSEPMSSAAQSNGKANIQDEIGLVPRWALGTKVRINTVGTLPSPLNSTDVYYFIPSKDIGIFNLSKKAYPNSIMDLIDLTSLGDTVINISRAELFYPGAIVKVSGTHNSRNDATYYVRSVATEGTQLRVSVMQKIPQPTPPGILIDGTMKLDDSTGYDHPRFCAIIQAPDLYIDTFVHERLLFEFDVHFSDSIVSLVTEDDAGVYDGRDPISFTSIAPSTHSILPMGYDVQFFDVGGIDDDLFFNNKNLGNMV